MLRQCPNGICTPKGDAILFTKGIEVMVGEGVLYLYMDRNRVTVLKLIVKIENFIILVTIMMKLISLFRMCSDEHK